MSGGGKGWLWSDLIAAVTVLLGVVCLEYLGGWSITQGLCAGAAENSLAGSSVWLVRNFTRRPSEQETFHSKTPRLNLLPHIWSFPSMRSQASLKWEELPSVIQYLHFQLHSSLSGTVSEE